jgi:hypothetical protein
MPGKKVLRKNLRNGVPSQKKTPWAAYYYNVWLGGAETEEMCKIPVRIATHRSEI